MAAAYAAMADNGVYHAPSFIDHIVDRSGSTIYVGENPGKQVVSPQIAQEATVALQAVVQSGTGTAAGLYNRPVAGKTGTTDSNIDAWFNGFTPQLETTVWMGNGKDEVPMLDVGGVGEVYGGTFPAHTWHDFMSGAVGNLPVLDFTPPNYAALPAAHYVTSPSLVAADVLDHNNPGCSATTYPYSNSTNPYNSYCSGSQSANGYSNPYSPPTTTAYYQPPPTQPAGQPQPPAPPAAGHRAPRPRPPPSRNTHP